MTPHASRRRCAAFLVALAVVAAVVLLFVGPIPQPLDYHAFADGRTFLGVPNARDVLSNLPFVLVGVLGIIWLGRQGRGAFVFAAELRAAYVFFGAVALVGLGSVWYHLEPSNESLAWDRLPLAAVTMSLLTLVISERLSPRWGGRLLGPLVLFALASVVYWHVTEQQGAGDLRPYALAQYYPGPALIVILWLLPSPYTRGSDYAWAISWYVLAKVLEFADGWIFDTTGIVSGHTLKHIAAAGASAWILRMLHLRRRKEDAPSGA